MSPLPTAPAQLVRARLSDWGWLEPMVQAYLQEMAAFDPHLASDGAGRFEDVLDVEGAIHQHGREVWLIETDVRVGWLLLDADLRVNEGPGTSLEAIYLAPTYRRRGIGRALWDALRQLRGGRWEFATHWGNRQGLAFVRAARPHFPDAAYVEQPVIVDGCPMRVHRLDFPC